MTKISDVLILSSALISMFASIYLWFSGSQLAGVYVGLWVPSLLGFGLYFKSVIANKGNE
jgi:hypothetical protein